MAWQIKGYFIITDISGYTEYLTKSELEHAHAPIEWIFNDMVVHFVLEGGMIYLE